MSDSPLCNLAQSGLILMIRVFAASSRRAESFEILGDSISSKIAMLQSLTDLKIIVVSVLQNRFQ